MRNRIRRRKPKARRPTKRPDEYFRRLFLCSNAELRFYMALQRAVGETHVVMCKVRVAALLGCAEHQWETLGRRVSQKEFDFVLVRRGSSFAAVAIELDDRTHELPERRRRDRFLEAACLRAGLPLVRFRTERHYDAADVWLRLHSVLGSAIEKKEHPRERPVTARERDVQSDHAIGRR